MKTRNSNYTFLAALFPGVGYMYLGLINKGLEALVLFILIGPVFRLLSLGFLSWIVSIPFWCYTFFDTLNLGHKIDKGEIVPDSGFILNGIFKTSESGYYDDKKIKENFWVIIGVVLIVLGILAIVNRLFYSSGIYVLIRGYIRDFLLPLLFIIAGAYMLFRKRR